MLGIISHVHFGPWAWSLVQKKVWILCQGFLFWQTLAKWSKIDESLVFSEFYSFINFEKRNYLKKNPPDSILSCTK
jgi:hypothetical protein